MTVSDMKTVFNNGCLMKNLTNWTLKYGRYMTKFKEVRKVQIGRSQITNYDRPAISMATFRAAAGNICWAPPF